MKLMMSNQAFAVPGFKLRTGSGLDRALLVKFIQRTYQELYPDQGGAHLTSTVDRYFSSETPLWWVEPETLPAPLPLLFYPQPIACLWLGNSIDQITGDRHAHILLLYVLPTYRRQGIATALIQHAEHWAKQRGDRQMGLQVFQENQAALNLYTKLGYQTCSLWMTKPLSER
jgi:ribosomal protein S18 acetylase RimI-like enzyme